MTSEQMWLTAKHPCLLTVRKMKKNVPKTVKMNLKAARNTGEAYNEFHKTNTNDILKRELRDEAV